MINLIKLIEKKTCELFSSYPNIWKGNNSAFFFYILNAQHEDKNLIRNIFPILKNSENAYKNIYISLLQFRSNDFSAKMKTLKYIFYEYVLCNDTCKKEIQRDEIQELDVTRVENKTIFNDATKFSTFLVEENESINVDQEMSCFFFSVIPHLIMNDYLAFLKERKKEKNETRLRFLVKGGGKKKSKTKKGYIKDLIRYTASKNILHECFQNIEDNTHNENVKGNNEQNMTRMNNILEERKRVLGNGGYKISDINNFTNGRTNSYAIHSENNKEFTATLKKGELDQDIERNEHVCCIIEKHYSENFLMGIFFYIKNMIGYYEKLVNEKKKKKKNSFKTGKDYISCFIMHSICILFYICCMNQNFISICYDLIKNIKNKLTIYMNTSIIISMSEFILFFSSHEKFVNVSNYLFMNFIREYKDCLTAVSFFDFIMKNLYILEDRNFFFKKYCSIILKAYFYHYRIFKNDLIYLLPSLIYEKNYKDVFCFLLYVPLLVDMENVESIRDFNSRKGQNPSPQADMDFKRTKEYVEKGKTTLLVQELEGIKTRVEEKNKRKVMDIRDNIPVYLKAYFESIIRLEDKKKVRRSWVEEITKIILHKLTCSDILEILNKESIKEILKNVNYIVRNNSKILLHFKGEFINLLKNESRYYYFINRKLLQILAENIKHMKITYDDIEDYYITLYSFFSNENYIELKFWISLIHAFTNIAIYCHDLSTNVLTAYTKFISQSQVTLTLKQIVIQHISLIKNVSYVKTISF
ncbi:conserved Plasmodium protein, unknown function [Plasmodium gonderi]|uniref:Uncharacterized protein n=1 Tax=Plasmodium gonderi TaxID=77519 RepID=A0A1Y1JFM2_PLAGO|nr:conserved Plasmodium protein, unknown function [Plasmodium gonderi]GAW81050.1 conserved Plasmodium protein, unknown function [Plasmodium gonderi]